MKLNYIHIYFLFLLLLFLYNLYFFINVTLDHFEYKMKKLIMNVI